MAPIIPRNPRGASTQPKREEEDLITRICSMLEQGVQPDQIREELQDELALEPINAGIIRTRKGALMVRVSDDRWPIAMYKKDWNILLAKVPAIKTALEELDIAEENPMPSRKVQNLQEAQQEAEQVRKAS